MLTMNLNDVARSNTEKNKHSITNKIGSMLGRVFTPSKMPLEGLCFIDINWSSNHHRHNEGAHVGKDGIYGYSNFLKNLNGNSIVPSDEDFYVPICIWKIDPAKENGLILRITEYILRTVFFFLGSWKEYKEGPYVINEQGMARTNRNELPSTLFHNVKENDIITFYTSGRQISLNLKQNQQNNINAIRYKESMPRCYAPERNLITFEQAFSQLEKESKKTKRGWTGEYYKWGPDIPDNTQRLINFYPSTDAKIFDYHKNTINPICNDDIIFFEKISQNNPIINPTRIDYKDDNIIFDFSNLNQCYFKKCFIDKGVLIIVFNVDRQLLEMELETEKSPTKTQWHTFRYDLNLNYELDPTSIRIDRLENNNLKCSVKVRKI